MESVYGICKISSAPIRAEASDKSEIYTQLLFGDAFEILETLPKWIRIRTVYDQYEGWIDPKQFTPISPQEFQQWPGGNWVVGLDMLPKVQTPNGETLYLVAGCTLPFFKDKELQFGGETYQFMGQAMQPDTQKFAAELELAARFYLNAPYLWGGRSPWGIDCSGLTQLVYKHFGIKILRDAAQQATQGETVDFLSSAKAGDLAFFDNEEGRIIHVGILLNNQEIIHASGRVKIDRIDNQGIYSDELGRHTHKLRIIKRFSQTPAYQ
ncbi:MAG: NlpC/P60 family protein [Sphingobacteriaceae bacterium]